MSEITDKNQFQASSDDLVKPDTESSRGRIERRKIALNVLMQMFFAILIFVLINYISYGNYQRWDLSSTKKYSVSEDTEAYLQDQLDHNVTINMAFLKR